jgi:hypothetical protein
MNGGDMILYHTQDGQTDIRLRIEGHAVWLSQTEMAELFGTTVPNVNIHVRNILKEKE